MYISPSSWNWQINLQIFQIDLKSGAQWLLLLFKNTVCKSWSAEPGSAEASADRRNALQDLMQVHQMSS